MSPVVSLAVVLSVVTQRRPSLLRDYTMSLDAIRLSFDVNMMLNLYSFVSHVMVWTGSSWSRIPHFFSSLSRIPFFSSLQNTYAKKTNRCLS